MLKINDLVEGEIYVTNYPGQGDYIFKSNGDNKDVTYLQVDRNSFSDYGDMSPGNGFKSYKLPTDEQKHWFLECEKANKFISYEEAMKTFTQKFETGKWYKCLWHKKDIIYIKPTSIHKTAIDCDGDNSIWCHHNNIIYNSGSYMPTALTIVDLVEDLSEIQQWLPEGHPDKVSNSLIGRYLKALVNNPVNIGVAKKGDYFIILDDDTECKSVKDNKIWSYKNRSEKINPEIWELMPVEFCPNQVDSIIEYVECVTWKFDSYSGQNRYVKGRIYKLNSLNQPIAENSKDNYIYAWNHNDSRAIFKPSTKEAFEAKNKPIIKEKPMETNNEFKVGDWVFGWFNALSALSDKAWKIEKIIDGYAYPKTVGNCGLKHLRRAKLEEIPTKDLSNEELLSIAKTYYKVGVTIDQKTAYNGKGGIFKIKTDNLCWNFNNTNLSVDGCGIFNKNHNVFAKIISSLNEIKGIKLSDEIEIGDEVEVVRLEKFSTDSGIYLDAKIGDRFIVEKAPFNYSGTFEIGIIINDGNGYTYPLECFKLIRKANNTTIYQQTEIIPVEKIKSKELSKHPKLIPIKVRNLEKLETPIKRTKLRIIKPKLISI